MERDELEIAKGKYPDGYGWPIYLYDEKKNIVRIFLFSNSDKAKDFFREHLGGYPDES